MNLRDAAESFAANEARRPYRAFPAPATSLGNRRDEPESPTTVPPMSPFDTMEEELAHEARILPAYCSLYELGR